MKKLLFVISLYLITTPFFTARAYADSELHKFAEDCLAVDGSPRKSHCYRVVNTFTSAMVFAEVAYFLGVADTMDALGHSIDEEELKQETKLLYEMNFGCSQHQTPDALVKSVIDWAKAHPERANEEIEVLLYLSFKESFPAPCKK